MSRLRIVHETVYRYRCPVRFEPHRLVLRPREGHDVDIVRMKLEVTPAHRITWSHDVFGNSIATLVLKEAAALLSIRSDVLLERLFDADEPYDRARAIDYPVTYPALERTMVLAYLERSFPEDDEAIFRFMRDQLGFADTGDAAAVLPRLNAAIHERFPYRRREARGVQSPAETLSRATGSCRDKATLFMECARALGIAARFVSGYLDCPASEAGRAATHAWTEVYLPEMGWCGYDPTLGEPTSHKHIVIAASNHPRGVMPVSGRYVGSADAYIGLEVAVQIEKTS